MRKRRRLDDVIDGDKLDVGLMLDRGAYDAASDAPEPLIPTRTDGISDTPIAH